MSMFPSFPLKRFGHWKNEWNVLLFRMKSGILKNGIMVLPIGGVFTFIENFKALSVSLI